MLPHAEVMLPYDFGLNPCIKLVSDFESGLQKSLQSQKLEIKILLPFIHYSAYYRKIP